MSWIDNLDANIIIKTGDGSEYSPKWLPGEKEIEYNISKFEFIDIDGTLIKRSQPKGKLYNIILIFQGEDHLDQSNAFENSAKNRNAWTIIHPYYGEILVQPLGLRIDNTGYNISRILVKLQETIKEEFPKAGINIVDQIEIQKINVDENAVLSTPASSPAQIQTQIGQIEFMENKYADLATTDADADTLRNLVNKAQTDIVNALSKPLDAMNSMIQLINYPILVSLPVRARLTALQDTFDNLTATLDNIVVEKNGLGLISSMSQVVSDPEEGDYKISSDVTIIIDELINYNNLFLDELDDRQSDRADVEGSYVPDFNSMNSLDLVVNLSLSNLFSIAFAARQERVFVLDADSNPIILCHRFYGMDSEDENLNEFISQNNLGSEELFQITKGREIIYYV